MGGERRERWIREREGQRERERESKLVAEEHVLNTG